MIACICGFEGISEGELMSHMLERHLRSYVFETCYHPANGETVRSSIRDDVLAALPRLVAV